MDSFGKNNLHFNGFVIRIYGCVRMPPKIKLSFEQNGYYSFRMEAKKMPLLSPLYFPMLISESHCSVSYHSCFQKS